MSLSWPGERIRMTQPFAVRFQEMDLTKAVADLRAEREQVEEAILLERIERFTGERM